MVTQLEINGTPYIGEVVIKQGTDRQGFYLHEVEIKEKLANVFKTATGSTSPTFKLIISQLLQKIKSENENNQEKFHITRKRKQINPIVQDGKVRDNYQDLLENKEYTPETIEQWDAVDWIDKLGGILPAMDALVWGLTELSARSSTLILA